MVASQARTGPKNLGQVNYSAPNFFRCETSSDPLDSFSGSTTGGLLLLSASVKLELRRWSFPSKDAVNQPGPDGRILWFSQHYAAKRRETPCQLGPHWDPVQFLVFFADPQGS
jgi:hypothetical protein